MRHKTVKSIKPKEAYDLFNPDVLWDRAYTSYFGVVPSTITITDVDTDRASEGLQEELLQRSIFFRKRESYHKSGRLRADETVFVLNNEVIVVVEFNERKVEIHFGSDEPGAMDIFEKCIAFTREPEGKELFLITRDFGLSLQSLRLGKIAVSLEDNYNDDLLPVHSTIASKLTESDKSGLILLHGAPGTGKSTYIRHLICQSEKKVIFLPPTLAGNLENPELISLIMSNRNSIVIIEDAEELIVSRENARNSCISMLLNLTDGLLGSCLGIQFICTFNTTLSNIDKALLRKGRLSALYEFKPLTSEKSRRLLTKLGKCPSENIQPMTLGDIFDFGMPDYSVEPIRKAIGFSVDQLAV